MKKLLRLSASELVVILFILTCLASILILPSVRPARETTLTSPVPPPYTVYTDTLSLPDGRVLPLECVRTSWEDTCRAIFSNGNVMDYAKDEIVYSPDNKYAFRPCVRSTHDSSCLNGAQLWNMAEGKLIKNYCHLIVFQWVQSESHVLAFIMDKYCNGTADKLVHLDAETGRETYSEKCSDFFMKWVRGAPWVAEACHVPVPAP